MKITKIDSVKRQIETAITTFFSYGDTVSIHTLTAAAYNVLKDLCDKKGLKNYIAKNSDLIPERYQSIYFRKINEAENFFKHADNDHDSAIEFNPKMTHILLFDAVRMYYDLTTEYPIFMGKFVTWFYLNNPDAISEKFRHLIDIALSAGADPNDRTFIWNLPAQKI